jgi:trans-2,3-dihydro-3-hydroxyanthranilate isomerase
LPTLDYSVVDVFTTEPLAGNPLAVVLNTCGLATEQMQAIAREFNLSETTFVERRDEATERAEGVRVRIFTAREELNFAGHPTLGTASVLKMLAPQTVLDGTVTLKENVGPIPVRFERGEAGPAEFFGEMTQRDPEFGAELDRAVVARLAGLEPDDLDAALPPQVASTGTAFAIVALRSQEALGRLKVDQEEATAWLRERGARWFYVLAPSLDQDEHGAKHYRARMQFYGGEDPATGSAAGCAIAYLVAHGAVRPAARVHLRQGVEMGRPSDLFLSAKKENARVHDVRVAGSTVLVAKGRLFLP